VLEKVITGTALIYTIYLFFFFFFFFKRKVKEKKRKVKVKTIGGNETPTYVN